MTIEKEKRIMEGIISAINLRRGMVAVQTTNGDFSVFELLGDDPVDLGDRVFWFQAAPLGSTLLTNITQQKIFEVNFQKHEVPESQLKKQLLID